MRVRTHSKHLLSLTGVLGHKKRQHGGTSRPAGLLLALTIGRRLQAKGPPRGLLLALVGDGAYYRSSLFFDAFGRADGALGNGWTGATWTISSGAALNTPTLGSELFGNTGFDSDTVWNKGTNWSIAAGVGTHVNGTGSNMQQGVSVVGNWYREVWTLLNRSAGSFLGIPGRSSLGLKSANGTYTDSGRANGTFAGVTASATGAGDIDNVSLKQLTLSELFATRNFGRSDVQVAAKLTLTANNPCGLVLNLDSTSAPANFVYVEHQGTNLRASKCVAGVYTELVTAAATYVAGAPIRVTKSGTTYKFYYNDVQIGTDQTVSDAGIIGNTWHGMMNTYELNTLDDFYVLAM